MSYSTGIVYKIVCTQDSGIVYIGSTFNLLRQRWQTHKYGYKKYLEGNKGTYVSIFSYFEKFGIENFKILKIKKYECCREHMADHKHLHMYEQLWINKTKGCVNKVNPFRIPIVAKEQMKEYQKEYNEKNKEQRKEQLKEYYEKNKEHKKEYYEKNKEKIECEICKASIYRGSLSKHKKTQKHLKNLEKK